MDVTYKQYIVYEEPTCDVFSVMYVIWWWSGAIRCCNNFYENWYFRLGCDEIGARFEIENNFVNFCDVKIKNHEELSKVLLDKLRPQIISS